MIEKMNLHYSFNNPASIHDEEALTALELAGRQGAKINEVVEDQNALRNTTEYRLSQQDSKLTGAIALQNATIEDGLKAQDDKIEYMKRVVMPTEVKDECQRLINDGEFDKAIDLYAGELEARVNNLLGSMSEGGTTSDAELIDLRVDANGSPFTTAGNAVRSMYENIKTLADKTTGIKTWVDGFTGFKKFFSGEDIPQGSFVDDTLVYQFNTTGTSGIMTPILDAVNMTAPFFLNVKTESDADVQLSIYVSEVNKFEEGKFAYLDKIGCNASKLVKINPANYDFPVKYIAITSPSSTSESFTVTFSDMTVFTSDLINEGFKNMYVSGTILELREEIREVEAQAVRETILASDMSNFTKWGVTNVHYGEGIDSLTFETSSTDTGTNGICSPVLDMNHSMKLKVKFSLEIEGFDKVSMWLSETAGYKAGQCVSVWAGSSNGDFEFNLDLPYHEVYDGISPKYIWFVAPGTGKFTISNFNVSQSQLNDIGYSPNIYDAFIEHCKESAIDERETPLVSPDGNKYLMQVGSDGSLVGVPVIPSKTLFIGNSLLQGFTEFGMAASDAQHDYYYYVNEEIANHNPSHTSLKISGTQWEGCTTSSGHNTWLNNVLLPYLTSDINLVLVQLGDNVNTEAKRAIFADGCINLLKFIRTHCPQARVCWVGAWYQSNEKQTAMINGCKQTGCTFINIWDLRTKENESEIGNTYTMADGTVNVIESSGVASHPGDAGMKAIADRILYQLGITEQEG